MKRIAVQSLISNVYVTFSLTQSTDGDILGEWMLQINMQLITQISKTVYNLTLMFLLRVLSMWCITEMIKLLPTFCCVNVNVLLFANCSLRRT